VRLSYPPEQRFKGRELDVTRSYKDALLQVGKEWEQKGEGMEWKVRTVDFWSEVVRVAGGEGDELVPYFT
jgi:hypothetical protein